MRLSFVLLTLASFAADAFAQSALPSLPERTRVRLLVATPKSRVLTGNLVEMSNDSVLVTSPRGVATVRRSDLAVLQVSEGRSRTKGAVMGAAAGLAGALGFATIGAITDARRSEGAQPPLVSNAEAGFIYGAVLSVPVGALIGAARGSEKWRTVWQRR